MIKIYFTEGTFVNKGKLLVKINDDDLQAQLKKIAAQLELAEDDETKLKQLLEKNAISKNDYDIANNKLKTLQAEKELLLAQIRKTEIYAPFAGIIGLRNISEGSQVNTSTLICKLIQQNPIKLEFSVPDKFISNLKTGQYINFIDKDNGKTFQAKIYAIEPAIDEATRTIKIRALCPNPSNTIIPEKFVVINLTPAKPIQNILLPAKTIIPVLEGEMVYVLKNSKVKAAMIKTGIRTNQEIEIKEGLKVGDTVIASGLLQLKPGMQINVRINTPNQ